MEIPLVNLQLASPSPKYTTQVPKKSWCWENWALLWALSLKFFVALGKSLPSLFPVCRMGWINSWVCSQPVGFRLWEMAQRLLLQVLLWASSHQMSWCKWKQQKNNNDLGSCCWILLLMVGNRIMSLEIVWNMSTVEFHSKDFGLYLHAPHGMGNAFPVLKSVFLWEFWNWFWFCNMIAWDSLKICQCDFV